MFGSDGPVVRVHFEIRFCLEVVNDWTKLVVATRSTEEHYSSTVIDWPPIFERIAAGTTRHVLASAHQFLDRAGAFECGPQCLRNIDMRIRIVKKHVGAMSHGQLCCCS